VTDPQASLELLIERLNSTDLATQQFVRAELSKHLEHDRRMDVHEVIRGYIAQGITILLPGGALAVAAILGLNGEADAAAIIAAVDLVGIFTAMWAGIRRRPK
jgi:hypothetical protein